MFRYHNEIRFLGPCQDADGGFGFQEKFEKEPCFNVSLRCMRNTVSSASLANAAGRSLQLDSAHRLHLLQCGHGVVSPPQVEPKSGESFPALVSWCPPLAFCSRSVCLSGLVVCSWPYCVVWFRLRVCFKRGYDPGHRPKDRVFPERPTTCRVGSPWWPGMRGDDPRTDPFGRYPFLCPALLWYSWWQLSTYFGFFFVASSFFVFSSSARTHRRGLVEEPPRVERALSVEVVRLSFPLLLQFFGR